MAMTAKQKAAAAKAKAEAARKEAAYLASFENPITSQYDPRIAANSFRTDSSANRVAFNPEMVGVMAGSYTSAPAVTPAPVVTEEPTTARAVLESMIRSAGIPSNLVNQSVSFLETLDENKIDITAMMQIYYNNKTFTTKDGKTVESPFYKQFTSLGEGIVDPSTGQPYSAKELMAWRLGIEQKVDQYGVSQKYKTDDVMKKLIKNNKSVDKFEEGILLGRQAATAADPVRVAALVKMGYIKDATGLTDFYMNEEIGQQQLEENKRIGAFATEALRAKDLGVQFDAGRIKQLVAATGVATEADAAEKALQLYQGVGANLRQTIAASGMYERTGQTAAESATPIQTELENELLYGMPSERRKRLAQQNANAFQAQQGTYITSGGNVSLKGSQSLPGLL